MSEVSRGESENCQAFNWGVREMSEVHEGSPRIVKGCKKRFREIVKRLRAESKKW